MKRKLYIPTSTLNFNNILSSESISPSVFYARRGYGFKRIEKVELNSFDNIILLYEKFPYFDIAESEIENYPMVVEINTSSCNAKFREVGKGVYACDETIYINPFDTVFWFNNINELVRTKVKATPSIENKLADLYDGCLAVVDESILKYTYSLKGVVDGALNEDAIQADIKADKLKGVLYGYILAYNSICSKHVAVLKMHIRELINALSAILTAPDFKPVMLKCKKIDALYAQLETAAVDVNEPSYTLDNIIQTKLREYKVPSLIEILKKEGLYETWCTILTENYTDKLSRVPRFAIKEGEDKMRLLDCYEAELYKVLIGTPKSEGPITVNALPKLDGNRIASIPNQEGSFLVKLLNLYLDKNLQKTDFFNDRYEFAKQGVILCKGELDKKGITWDGSVYKTYLNALLSNLKSYTAFDVNAINSLALKSFALFFQKANLEIDELKELMISKGEGDMRYVYSFWGAIFGFAEMPKTLTSVLFNSEDEKYKVQIYKELYKRLFNISLKGNLPKRRYTMPKTVPVEIETLVLPEKPKAKRAKKSTKTKVQVSMPELIFTEEVPIKEKPFVAADFLASLKSIAHFNEVQLKQLRKNWNITVGKYTERTSAQVDFFINLSAKQGRERNAISDNKLYAVLTADLAQSLKKEIKGKLNIK